MGYETFCTLHPPHCHLQPMKRLLGIHSDIMSFLAAAATLRLQRPAALQHNYSRYMMYSCNGGSQVQKSTAHHMTALLHACQHYMPSDEMLEQQLLSRCCPFPTYALQLRCSRANTQCKRAYCTEHEHS